MEGNADNVGGWGVSRGRITAWAAVVALILLVPLIAMQFTEEVNWDLFDFAFMGTLLFGSACTYELVARKMSNVAYRAAVGIAVGTAVLLVWINGAVGIIGDGPVNLMYLGVIAVGLIGALIAHFRPRGMSRALFATALAQALVPVIALIIWKSQISWEPGMSGVFGLNAFFVMLFIGSALLFQRAARKATS